MNNGTEEEEGHLLEFANQVDTIVEGVCGADIQVNGRPFNTDGDRSLSDILNDPDRQVEDRFLPYEMEESEVDRNRQVDRQVEETRSRSLPSKEKAEVVMQLEFDQDLGTSMVYGTHGHDPYHHVGKYVVAECIGVDLC